ncbi:unnamed protein product [Aphanomyces euteiches]
MFQLWRRSRVSAAADVARQVALFSTAAEETSRVFIGGLPFSATPNQLRDVFGEFGTIETVDMLTRPDGRPNGSAYIGFSSPVEATAALKMHKASFGPRWISVERAKKAPPAPKSIWVGGLPFSTTPDEVTERCCEYGQVVSVDFLRRQDGKRNGTCIVTFATNEEATAALALHKATFGSRWVQVKPYHDLQIHKTKAKRSRKHATRVFVGNLPYSVTEDHLASIFEDCGDIVDVHLFKMPDGVRSRGYGYIQFKLVASRERALKLHGIDVDGRDMTVKLANGEDQGEVAPSMVRVMPLPEGTDEDAIYAMFEHCGEVHDIRIGRENKTGMWLAEIDFASAAGAQEALTLTGADVEGQTILVVVVNHA